MVFDNGNCRCHGQLSPVHSSNGDIARVTPLVSKEGDIDYTDCIMQRLGIWLAVRKGERRDATSATWFQCSRSEYSN